MVETKTRTRCLDPQEHRPHQIHTHTLPGRASNNFILGSEQQQMKTSLLRKSSDLDTLQQFFHATGGHEKWLDSTGWMGNRRLLGWKGVELDEDGHVKKLILQQNACTGRIPSTIGNLTTLIELSLGGNKLSGHMPSPGQRSLWRSFARPGNSKALASIPSQIGKLSKLTHLRLQENELSGVIPSTLGDLSKLLTLDLSSNKLTGSIPSQIGLLSSLTHLNLRENELTGAIPSALGGLSALERLSLSGNKLSGSIPSTLAGMSTLVWLDLSSNQLRGSIPSTLADMSTLVWLDLSSNQLWGYIPPRIGKLSSLTHLHLQKNELNGPIPSTMKGLSNLLDLNLSGNNLSGEIPPSLGDLSALVELNLSSNKLSGAIPTSLGKLSFLVELNLSSNKLSGFIPPQFGNLRDLKLLLLQDNEFKGAIPYSLGNLLTLEELDFSSNRLSGAIPSSLGYLLALVKLNLSSNKLSGSIPPLIGKLSNLKLLLLQHNELKGVLPSPLGGLSALEKLDITANKLSGIVPTSFSGLASLEHMECNQQKGFYVSGEPLPKESMDSWRLGLVRLQGLERVAPQDHLSDPALDSVETMSPTPSNEGDKPLLNSLGDDGFSLTNPGRPPFAEHVDYSPMSLPLPSEKGKPHVYSSTYAEVDVVTTTYSPKVTSPMPGQNERLEVSFESRVTMFEGLHELVKESRVTLAEIRQLTSAQATSFEDSPPVPSETLHELNRLVKMAKYLEESTANMTRDKEMQRRERSLVMGSWQEAHYTTLKTGLCKAYLAACVVGSDLVSTSKTGTMGTVGKVLKLIAGVAPVLGGLTNMATTALEAGDRYLQTQRVVKIADLAQDVVECSRLAKRVAMEITEGLLVVDTNTSGPWAEKTAWHLGRPSFQGATVGCFFRGLPEGANAEALLDWFAEGIVSTGSILLADTTKGDSTAEDGRRNGEKHLRMLLRAIGRDCLRDASDLDAKVEALVRVVLPRAVLKTDIPEPQSVEQPRAESCRTVVPLVVSPSGKTVSGVSCEVCTKLPSNLEGLAARIETLEASDAGHVAKIEGLENENSKLWEKVAELDIGNNRSDEEIRGAIDAGGGMLFANKRLRQREPVEGKWSRLEEREHSNGCESPTTPEEFELVRENIVFQLEQREIMEARLARLEDSLRRKQQGFKAGDGRKTKQRSYTQKLPSGLIQ